MVKQAIAISGTAFMLFLLIFVGPAFASVITIRTGEDASSEVQIVCDEVVVRADDSGSAAFTGGDLRYCNQPGEPQIPWKVMDVLLPPNAELATVVAAMRATYDMVEGAWNVGPTTPPTTWIDGKEIVDWPTDKNIEDGYDLDIYRTDAFWPQPRARLLGAGGIHNFRLAKIAVPLIRYNPITGQLLSLAKADLSVTFSRGKAKPVAQSGKRARARVKKLTGNFSAAAGEYDSADGDITNMPSSDTSEGGISPADLDSTGYTIITTAAIQNASTKLSSFVAHKESRGFTVKVVTEAATADATHYLTGSTADERAENIRAWLQNHYIADDTLYVLFIGDPHTEDFDTDESVPMKMLWPRSNSDTYRDAPSDFYFCDLTGNWDLDGDGLYGESGDDFGAGGVDKYWEVLVGRIPYYGIIADTDAILQKTIDYENSEDVDWRRNVMIAMVPLSEGTFSYDLGEKIKDELLEPEAIASTRVYRDGYGFTPSPSYHCSRDYPATVWSRDEFGLVVWLTHGWSRGASSVITSDDAVNLNASYPGTTWQGSCTTGQPEDDNNLAYAILKNGGIGSMGASRVSWYSSATNMDSVGGMGYQYALRVLARQSGGDSLCDLRQDGYGYWPNCCVFNLYGDPSVVVMGPTPAFTITPTDAVYMPASEGLIGSASRTFTLNNNSAGRGSLPLDWTASHSGTWFDLSSYGGTIDAETSATVTVTLNAEAINANAGAYEDTITFTDTTNGIVQERAVVLEIQPHQIAGHWKLDETGGTTATDSSGGGNDGILINMDDADWVGGQFGNALEFDDVNDYLYMESFSLPQESFTAALWFKPIKDLSSSNGRRDLMYWHIGGEPHMSFNRAGDGKIGLYVNVDDVEYDDVTTATTSWSAGAWYHIAVTFDGSDFKVYLNSALENSVNHPGMHVVATGLSVGSDEGAKAFGCTIDDVRFYNHALSSAAVQALLQGGQAENPKPEDGTTNVRPHTGFQWTPGLAAASHDVYLGTDADAVASATRQCCEYKACVYTEQFVGPVLISDTEYFWRVDGVTSRGAVITTGAVWTFVTGETGAYDSIYEAEEAVLSGPEVESSHSGYTGSGYIDYINTSRDYAEYAVLAHYSGGHELAFRYALESGNRPLEIRLDGDVIEPSLDFPSTGSWANWDYTANLAVTLSAGAHTIRAAIADYKGANVDHLRIAETEAPPQAGDISGDGEIDAEDFAKFAEHWGDTACLDNPACGGADLDGNRNVNACDLAVLGKVWLDGK